MSEYDGLNLPELLALLNDIVRPEPVPWTPQTIGWVIVGAWLLSVLALFGWNRYRHWKKNRYRREALAMLGTIAAQTDEDPAIAAQQVATLLKRTALVAYPRAEVAGLYGVKWATFLCESAGHDPVVETAARELATAAYRADADGGALIAPARRWIEAHGA